MNNRILLLFLIIACMGQSFAQTGFQYLYQSETSIEVDAATASNGDVLLAADTYNDTAAFFHRLIIQRLDVNGNVKQTAGLFRPPSFRMSGGIHGTSDNGALVMGTVNIPLEDADSVFVIKLDNMGQISWSKGFQVEPNTHEPRGAIETADGSYVVYGTYEHVNFAEGIFLVKISSTGSLVWSRTINSQLAGAFMKVGGIVETSNGEFWLSGSTRFNSEGSWLAKLNSIGETQSVTFLNTHNLTPSQPEPFALFQQANGELDVFYNSLAFQSGESVFAIRTDANGTPTKATRFYRGSEFGEITDITPNGDGSYLAAGYYFPGSLNRSKGLAYKINADYTAGWKRQYGTSYIEITNSILPTSDGGVVLAGFADFDSVVISPSENGLFPWLIKANNQGQTSCYDDPVAISTRDTTVTTMSYQLDNVAGVSLGDIAFRNITVGANPDTVSCAITGLEHSPLTAFKAYPNPSNGLITIEKGKTQIDEITLFDLFGKKLSCVVRYQGSKIEIHTLVRGMALLRITTSDGIWTQKLLFE